ncbi:uncharacterized protein ARMOST_01556 [Armillaria ostoyae]|uniref:Uncharacterized protein n=1 Tax=Armillaria ostoyae TaxID=47428 RepID=A0A284QPB9_ARMOS|nr:uncharacterized protein ARMOST_01556 [Armillaria ostoyae]
MFRTKGSVVDGIEGLTPGASRRNNAGSTKHVGRIRITRSIVSRFGRLPLGTPSATRKEEKSLARTHTQA